MAESEPRALARDGRAELSAEAVLRASRSKRAAARAQLRELPAPTLVQMCQELAPELRSEFLMLLDHPEAIVPQLEPASLAIAIRATGMSEGAWLLAIATPEQRRACLDLDCWDGERLEPTRIVEWIDALIEAGRSTLVQSVRDLDPELWLLALRECGEVAVVAKQDEPPEGYATEDGVVYFRAGSDEGFARMREVLQATFAEAQPAYWQLVYGMLFELPAELEDYALRWRNARLSDLGFPEREWAMRAYRPLTPEAAERIEGAPGSGTEPTAHGGSSVVTTAELPRRLRGTLVGQALMELPPERATDILGYVLAVANSLAVADRLRLSEPESVPRALRKAIAGIDRGLSELARARSESPAEVLESTRPLDLFRIGITVDPKLRESE